MDAKVAEPVGCVAVTAPGVARPYYAAPRPDSRAHPDPRLDRNHPGAGFYYLFNVEPGRPTIVAQVGEHRLETTFRADAGTVNYVPIYFVGKRFPDNPTPLDCMADWPPKDEE